MGLFDDAVPGGNIAKPLLIALGALLAGKMLSGGGRADDEAEAETPRIPQGNAPHQQTGQSQNQSDSDGGLLGGGLGDLLEKLRNQGQGGAADSWVKPDVQNEPVQPADLGKAIGDKMLAELSRRTGIPQDQLLDQLSKALPGVVDKLTPQGRVPSNDQVAGEFGKSPW